MVNSPDQLISIIHQKLKSDRINKSNNFDSGIANLYFECLKLVIKKHQDYRYIFPNLVNTLEVNDAIAYSLFIFFRLYDEFLEIAPKDLPTLDRSLLDENVADETIDKFLEIYKKNLKPNKILRISEQSFSFENLTNKELREIASSLIHSLQSDSKSIEWSNEKGQQHMFQLVALKALLDILGKTTLFYFVVSMFLDRLNSSEYFQAARDVTEEIILTSFKDNCPELGFLCSYHCYSRQESIHAAILSANISLYAVIQNKKLLLDKYVQEIIWETIKCFRNTKMHPLVIQIYEKIPTNLCFTDYERRSIDHAYYLSLLMSKTEFLPEKVLNYLHKEREGIFNAGYNEALPWLLLLHNLKRLYPNADFSTTGLGYYVNVFETIVPKDVYKKYTDIINGTSENTKEYLKLSLIKLNDTRNKSDIVYDISHALTIANRQIEDSFRCDDEEAILLSMILKSDFSLLFRSKETAEFRPFELPNSDLSDAFSLYAEREKLFDEFCLSENQLITWLAVSEGKVFQLSLLNGNFIFSKLDLFDWDAFHNLKKTYYFSNLSFEDTKKDIFGIQKVSSDEFLCQQKEIKEKVSFAQLYSMESPHEIFMIKDMELARFPHNLFLDENSEFIHRKKPIANILSTEWYLSCKDEAVIDQNMTKSIWIPTDSGDITLNKLYDSLKSEIEKYQFQIFSQVNIPSPLSSDLNIVCSHGNRDISSLQVIYPGDNPLDDLERIVGSGKVLVFFVCHSGSYKDEFFKNNITSLVKEFISRGYRAVIAPFWALHVNIPSIWLENFLISMTKGLSVNFSVFNANRAVSKVYQTPVAWASMHLYGNPNLTVKLS